MCPLSVPLTMFSLNHSGSFRFSVFLICRFKLKIVEGNHPLTTGVPLKAHPFYRNDLREAELLPQLQVPRIDGWLMNGI